MLRKVEKVTMAKKVRIVKMMRKVRIVRMISWQAPETRSAAGLRQLAACNLVSETTMMLMGCQAGQLKLMGKKSHSRRRHQHDAESWNWRARQTLQPRCLSAKNNSLTNAEDQVLGQIFNKQSLLLFIRRMRCERRGLDKCGVCSQVPQAKSCQSLRETVPLGKKTQSSVCLHCLRWCVRVSGGESDYGEALDLRESGARSPYCLNRHSDY
ncbi:hypothetical protein Baya_8064 [Bagarius yarrelli]|uniref:Uncharacterized protein n=1 Tax=Bagarius yarrelli TaxID=175774 RepID=A0A556U474_BAGYA|nr:hypothetical protein Baya_8064 [Bagarius yarrelli]